MITWKQIIETEAQKEYYKKLIKFIENEAKTKTIFPPSEKRFSFMNQTPISAIKVVIIGQDPYHDDHQAHGLAFSVENKPYPPSLKNIFKELKDDLNLTEPKTGNLKKWAQEGVLLLNTILTVEAHKALSHKGIGWEIFTENILKQIAELDRPIVFILWGSHARSYKRLIHHQNHFVIESVHPSPLSAYQGFFGSKPFSKANQYLISKQIKPIDWSL